MQKSHNKKVFKPRLIIFGVIIVFVALILLYPREKAIGPEANLSTEDVSSSEVDEPVAVNTDQTITLPEVPAKKVLEMSFQSQAPFADWSDPWQNGCEEASIDMVRYYYNDKKMSKENMHDDILSMVEWQMTNWGGHRDLNAEKTLLLAKSVYGFSGKVITDYSIDSIKQSIVSDIPVIVPTDGRLLGNPNFRGSGPPYHMLVIKGYDQNGFITNDPGTRNGESYYYSFDTVLNSVKNPDGGAKELLILSE